MTSLTPTAFGAAIAGACALAAALPAQDPPLRTLSRVDVEYAEPFSCVSGFRELSDGRLIVADVKEKTVQLIDLRRGTATRVGQQGQGPGEWSTPQALFALPGDTTLLYDPQNQRFLTILPNGSVGKAFTVTIGGGPQGMALPSRPQGVDRMGRLYYQGPSVRFEQGSAPVPLDSAPIVRYDRETAKVDTLLWWKLPRSNVQTTGTGTNQNIRIMGANPLAPQGAWTVAPDGRIAIAHADPYQVEWATSSKARSRGPAVTYSRRGVAESDKRPLAAPDCSVTISFGDAGGGGARGGEVRARVAMTTTRSAGPPRTDWPESMPPFAAQRFGAPRVAPSGQVWVPRSHGVNDAPTYDVFDAMGKLVDRITMPKGTRLLGFGAGTVYAYRMDEDDLVYLQRYRLDAAR